MIFGGLFTILSCQNTTGNSKERPESVRFVPKSLEEAHEEQGIDAIPEDVAVFMEWFEPEDTEIHKFEVFRQTEPEEDFYLIDTVEDTFYIDYTIDEDLRYYYYVLSVNYDDRRSVPDDTVDYKILEKPARLSPNGWSQTARPVFQWEDNTQANYYIIRLIQADNDQLIWKAVVQANLGSQIQTINYNSDGSAAAANLDKESFYQWRVDVIGPETNCGSESPWVSFQIQ